MNQKSRKNLSRNLNGNMILLRADGEEDNRQVQLSFSSEEPYQRWFGPEILSHEEGAADLSRLQDIGVLLWQHRPDAPIGKIIDVSIDTAEHRGVATVQFDEDELSDRIYQKVLSGTLKGVSVGYNVSYGNRSAKALRAQMDDLQAPVTSPSAGLPTKYLLYRCRQTRRSV